MTTTRNLLIILILLLLLFGGYYFYTTNQASNSIIPRENTQAVDITKANNVEPAIIGKWRSLDDAKSEHIFSNGKVISYYDGKELANEDYKLFNTVDVPGEAVENLENNSVYMRFQSKDEGELWYKIIKLDGNNLEMIYLAHGNILRYQKINK